MSKSSAFSNKDNVSRLSLVGGDSRANTYSSRANVSRLSIASSESKASPYSGRINTSRLSGVNAEAFVRNASLFSRIGGESAVSAIVRSFYGKALVDPRIKRYFDLPTFGEMEQQIREQIAFIGAALGGPVYEGMDMRAARDHLKSLGLSAAHFDAVDEGLAAILRGQNMPHPLIEELQAFCQAMRKEVLG